MNSGIYQVIVVSPEIISNDKRFVKFLLNPQIASRLFAIIFDECHCVSQWGATFRKDYARMGFIRFIVPKHTRFTLTSATLPYHVFDDCIRLLHFNMSNTHVIHLSNDRPNVFLSVRQMKYSIASFYDLAFMVPTNASDRTMRELGSFMVFAQTRGKCEGATKYLKSRVKKELRNKIVWLHAGMSKEFREEAIARIKAGELWGAVATDVVGMVRLFLVISTSMSDLALSGT
jgi:superfamily II DNA helicase RecQ